MARVNGGRPPPPAAVAALGAVVFFAAAAISGVEGKACTNAFPGLSTHTERAAAQLRSAPVLREPVHRGHNHGDGDGHEHEHNHLTPTDESAWMSLMPRRALRREEAFDWFMLYRKLRGGGGDEPRPGAAGPWPFLSEASLHDVRLEPGTLYWRAQQTNLEYLLLLDVDRLVWNFRKQAGLAAPGTPYGGWEGPDVQLWSHYIGAGLNCSGLLLFFFRALPQCYDTLNAKMSAVIDALDECQRKMGTGYLSAFPSEFFDWVEAISPVWAPYYTIHKIMQGLLDQYSRWESQGSQYGGENGRLLQWMREELYSKDCLYHPIRQKVESSKDCILKSNYKHANLSGSSRFGT